ncbi:MAG: efflux RND transporter periplasmic adaptor subunit, partial [Bacteroidia bacterium]
SKYNIESSQAALKEASANLEKTFIYSPVEGTVYKLNVEKGERVQGVQGFQGTEILRLANLNEMEVSVEVNENDIIRVHRGDTAIVEVDAYINQKFKGIVTEVANSANTSGISIDQVTNFVVKIRLLRESYSYLITDRNPVPFRPGMSANVDIQTFRANKVVSIPIPAVTTRSADSLNTVSKIQNEDEEGDIEVKDDKEKVDEDNEKKSQSELKEYVFIEKDGQAIQVEVKSGIQDNEFIEIKEGLKEGDIVIAGPYAQVSRTLRDKTKIKVVSKKEIYNKE